MKNKIERKNAIIEASIDLMYLNGYNGTSVKDITDAAGIPKGSFYNYFQDKENYAVDALDYYLNIMKEPENKILNDKNLNPLDRVIEYFNYRINHLESKGLKFGCLAGNLAEEMGDTSELIRDATDKVDKEILDTIHANFVEAKEQGDLKMKGDLKVFASFILSSWQGAMLRMKMKHNKDILDEFIFVLKERLTT